MITKQNLFALTVFIAGLSMAQPSTAQQVSRKVKETLVSVIEESEMIGNSFTFSLDIRRIAYRIIVKGKQIAVVDTLLGKPYDEVSAPVFSSDSRHFAYTAKKGKNNLLIIDHKQNLMLDSLTSITSILFSSDNKSVSYILFDGRQYYMVFHGAKGKPYDGIDENTIT